MNRWWRAYAEAQRDPKIQSLSGDMFKAWFNLCCWASEHSGEIPSAFDAALALHMTESKARATMAYLAGRGLFDAVDGHYFEPHNWRKRQYNSDVTDKTNAERQKRFRDKQKSVTVTPDVTPLRNAPDLQIQITEKEERKKEPASAGTGILKPSDDPKPKRKKGTCLSVDWRPNDTHYAEGQLRGHTPQTIDRFATDMRLWADANANRAVARKADWDLTFLGWIRRQPTATPTSNVNGYHNGHRLQTGSPLIAAADDLLAAIRGDNFGTGNPRDGRLRVLDEPRPALAGPVPPWRSQ